MLFLLFSCNSINRITNTHNLIQGDSFIRNDIKKIYIGMTKKQVINILGNFTITSFYEFNTYYYISIIEEKFKNILIKKVFKLEFNKKNFLIRTNYQKFLLKKSLL